MKTLLLVTTGDAVVALAAMLLFHVAAIRRKAAAMTLVFLATVPAFAWAFQEARSSPILRELDVLPFALFLYVASFFGGVLQVYNLAERGFSLRILIDVRETGRMGVDDLMTRYGGGRGMDWMFQKRVDDLVERGMIRLEGDLAHPTLKGRWVGSIYRALKRFLNLA